MMNKLFITQNTKGGVGKTEVATLLTTILDEAKMDWEYGEIDEFRKLGIWLSEKKQPLVSIKPAPDMSKELKSIEDYKRFFNPVLELLEHQVSVLDLGGSVSPEVSRMGRRCRIGQCRCRRRSSTTLYRGGNSGLP